MKVQTLRKRREFPSEKKDTLHQDESTSDGSSISGDVGTSKKLKPSKRWIINSEEAKVSYTRHFLSKEEQTRLYNALKDGVSWSQEKIKILGRECTPNRLVASYGDDGLSYGYSGIHKVAIPWNEELKRLKECVEKETEHGTYNFALLNYYRTGEDYIGFHSDAELDLVQGSSIASVSLGQDRDFVFKHVENKEQKMEMVLHGGSLMEMLTGTQKHYKHSLPKRKKVQGGRINITFRSVKRRDWKK